MQEDEREKKRISRHCWSTSVLGKACEEEIVAFVVSLVPLVPLVPQQDDYLTEVSRRKIEVLELFGDMGVDY